jgi:hypothetical protein
MRVGYLPSTGMRYYGMYPINDIILYLYLNKKRHVLLSRGREFVLFTVVVVIPPNRASH